MALDISASEPIILPSSILDQIPLGVHPVDLASLKATELDHGPQYYPDKLLPTITLLQGQEPTLGNGQTIYTDGNHALLVKNTGSTPSGGGGGLPAVQQVQQAELYGSGAHRRFSFVQANMLIISCVVTVSWNGGFPLPYPANELGTIGIQDLNTATFVPLVQFRSNSPAASGVPVSDDKVLSMVYPGGLNLHPALPIDPTDTYFFALQNAVQALLYNVVLMLGSSV